MFENQKVAVVIPSYKVAALLPAVICQIGPEIDHIIVVDDACPENSGRILAARNSDPRVRILENPINLGVGGATIRGFNEALKLGASIIVKIDGDGQMNPSEISRFIQPIARNQCDYTKGNRFHNFDFIERMPKIRILGNLALTLFSKMSSGYWNVLDPNNGFLAISSSALKHIPLHKISNRYFFESDMLFRLYLSRAVVLDVPIMTIYGNEKSNLNIGKALFEFSVNHLRNFLKRLTYIYILRDFTLATVELILGSTIFVTGVAMAIYNSINSASTGSSTPNGTLILITLEILVGLQLLLGFAAFDINNVPKAPITQIE